MAASGPFHEEAVVQATGTQAQAFPASNQSKLAPSGVSTAAASAPKSLLGGQAVFGFRQPAGDGSLEPKGISALFGALPQGVGDKSAVASGFAGAGFDPGTTSFGSASNFGQAPSADGRASASASVGGDASPTSPGPPLVFGSQKHPG